MSGGFTDRSGLTERIADGQREVVIVCELVQPRERSILVRDSAGVEAWLARKLVSIEGDLNTIRITLPAWLAAEKGLSATAEASQKSLF